MARPVFEMFSHAKSGTSDGQQVWWRLVAGNRRELGRCPEPVAGADEAVEAVHELLGLLPSATTRLDVERHTQRWRWSLRSDALVRAVSTRGYSRRVECHLSLQQFLVLAPVAEVEPRLKVYGARRDVGGLEGRSRPPAPLATRS